jgi:L-ribulokinase
MAKYSIGIDFGTNSVRALIVNTGNGNEAGSAVVAYPSGTEGILLDPKDHNLARQSPLDYLAAMTKVIKRAMREACKNIGVRPDNIAGIGVDTTGSTPIPVDKQNQPICLKPKYRKNLNACAWLWKDHTSFAEAGQITETARRIRPHYLAKCGGAYSSEWYWSKLLHCCKIDPELFADTYAWVECEDFIPAVLCGIDRADDVLRGVCAAGHKAMYNRHWGGYPDHEFLLKLNPALARLRDRLPDTAYAINHCAGKLSGRWSGSLGLPAGIPVAVGAFDAHLGAVGSGIRTGTLVKIIGTSTCDIMVSPNNSKMADIPGVCGIVDGSVLPGYFGIEAGQSAVGDIFKWFVNVVCKGDDSLQVRLSEEAKKIHPGASGLVALDWNNGNRTILVDPRLTGLIVGLTLHTPQHEIYRALLEATAFGALTIINRIEEYKVRIEKIVCGGGIAEKNDLFMQIYADVLNRPMCISRSKQTCALGAAIAGALAANIYPSIELAIRAMTGIKPKIFNPIARNAATYRALYRIYKQLHDAFSASPGNIPVNRIMKDLLKIKTGVCR